MKFKIDENLPAETAATRRRSGFVANTVADEDLSGSDDETVDAKSRSEDRILVTLDLDFANSGIIVLRLKHQDKTTVLSYVRRLATALANRSPQGELWIIDGNRIRFRLGS